MSKFGPYEPVGKMDVAGSSLVARKGGGGAPHFVIKSRDSGEAARDLRGAAELQKVVAGKHSNWLPILEIHTLGTDGVYVVSPLQPKSIQSLIEKKITPTVAEMSRICTQIAHGAEELASQFGRPHGNIKPTNVLLNDTNVDRASVLLADPAPPESANSKNADADRRGLGRLIFEWVTGLAYQEYFWPLRSSKKWEALGADEAKWLDLANRLLAPAGDAKACDLATFGKEVAQESRQAAEEKKAAGGSGMKIALATVIIFILAAIGGYWYMQQNSSNVAVAPPPATQQTTQPTNVSPTTPAPVTPAAPLTPQQQLQAAMQSAQSDLDSEVINFANFADQVHTLAPDLYDLSADVETARGVTLSPAGSIAEAKANGQAAIANVRAIRKQSVHNALAAAKATKFTHPEIAAGLAKFAAKQSDSESALKPMAAEVAALKQLDTDWSTDSPLPSGQIADSDAQAIDATYFKLLQTPANAAIEKIVKNPSSASSVISQFLVQFNSFRQTAAAVAVQFQAAADMRTQLSSVTNLPPAEQWDTMAKATAPPAAGWPDAQVAELAAQAKTVAAALRCTDANQLLPLAQSKGPPALIAAVCSRFPTVHGEPDLDAQILQAINASLNSIPPTVSGPVADLWVSRLQSETDPTKAKHLLDLVQPFSLPKSQRELALAFYSARLADLKSNATDEATPDDQRKATQAFLDQTATVADSSWPLSDSDKQTAKTIAATLNAALVRPPPIKLSSDFQAATDGSGDYLYVPSFDPNHPMRFKRLLNPVTGNSFYLCTTEATVGWFVGLFDDPQHQIILRSLMDFTIPSKMCGPATWKPDFLHGGLQINLDRSWLATNNHNWDSDDSRYIPSGDGPTGQSPMQYVSPLASMYAAWLVGCRLPTVEEWKVAYKSDQRDSDDNVSGDNWRKLRESINALSPPDVAANTCHRFRVELGIENEDSTPALYAGSIRNDGSDVLWYRDAPPNAPKFHDMHGNIAEWILSSTQDEPTPRLNSDRPLAITDETGPHTINNQDDAALATFYTHCLRVGLSTTSGRDADGETPIAPPETTPSHHHQYFDLGFRLAMDDPNAPPAPNLAAVVRKIQPVGP